MKLSYSKFRKIGSLLIKNEILRDSLQDLLEGKEVGITELGLLDMLEKAELDIQIIEILTDSNYEDISAEEGMKILLDFFLSIKNSFQSLKKLLLSLGFNLQAKTSTV